MEKILTFIALPLGFNMADGLLKGVNELLLATTLIASHYVVILEIGQVRVLERADFRFRNRLGRGAEHMHRRTRKKDSDFYGCLSEDQGDCRHEWDVMNLLLLPSTP